MAEKKITPLQQKFISEYMVDQNATQAYLRASPKVGEESARRLGAKLLTNVDIKAETQRRMDVLLDKVEITAQRILEEIVHTATFDPKEMFDEAGNLLHIKDMPEHVRRAIGTVKVRREFNGETDSETGAKIYDTIYEVKQHDKLKGLELLGRNKVLFTDKLLLDAKVASDDAINPLDTANRIIHFLELAKSRMIKDAG